MNVKRLGKARRHRLLGCARWANATPEDRVIGTVSYYWEHRESLWLEVGIVIYTPSYWNGGYGTEALALWPGVPEYDRMS
ncbi:hypothetical protein GCM10025857_28990 [Alicyclobacillus contaminans]|nr:hypothetical protein GCM10025857_28990 [Alicyclobacillus contaminans]